MFECHKNLTVMDIEGMFEWTTKQFHHSFCQDWHLIPGGFGEASEKGRYVTMRTSYYQTSLSYFETLL